MIGEEDGLPRLGDTSAAGSKALPALFTIARKRWKIIVAVIVVVVAASIGASLLQHKRYQAIALVEISRNDLAATLTGTQSSNPTGTDFSRVAATDATVAESVAVARAAARAVHSHLTAVELLASSSVTSSPDNDLLSFAVTSSEPGQAVLLANAYATAYTKFQAELDTASVQRARRGVALEIAQLNRKHSALPATLTSRLSELQVLEALQSSNTTVARQAANAAKTQPKLERNVILGILAGVILAICMAVFLEAVDSRVTDEREVINRLGWPLLARVPEIPKFQLDSVASLTDPLEQVAEAFRIMRAQLHYSLTISPAKVVGITSALSSEGKSTTSGNLSVALARAGSRAILLELDLRRPTLRERFGISPGQPGVCDVIFGDVHVDEALCNIDLTAPETADVVHSSEVTNAGSLSVMVAGPAPPSVGELMASDLIPPIMQQLSDTSDIVIVDLPPVLGVGDVTALADLLGSLLLVVRIGMTTRGVLDELRRSVDALPVAVVGVAASGGNPVLGDRYGYGYGYTYRPDEGGKNGRSAGRVARLS